MMKNIIYTVISLILFCSCSKQENKENSESTIEGIESESPIMEPQQLSIKKTENVILSDWMNYYKKLDSSFSLENFLLERTDTISFIQGNVFGNFDQEFDSVYNDFIVFSPNKKSYIDFDSYQWTLDDDNTPIFSPDQEINLVDINKKSVTRIGFNGPLQWTENAFWKNDTIIILLENSSEKILRINELNILNGIQKTFKHMDNLRFSSNYSELRLRNKGIKIE